MKNGTLAAITWNPAIGLPEAITLALVVVAVGSWLAFRGSAGVGKKIRTTLFILRFAALLALSVLWLNPGRWRDESLNTKRDWLVLLDRSRSMNEPLAAGETRWQAGSKAATTLARAEGEQGAVRIRTFSTQIEDEAEIARLAPDGTGTDIARTITSALDQKSTPLAGIVLLTDGRSTTRTKLDEVARRAKGRGIPIHTVPLVGETAVRDLALTAIPRHVTAFKGQPVKVSAMLENRGLGPVKPSVVLLGPDGKEIARKDVTLSDGQRAPVVFELPQVVGESATFTLRTEPWPGEHLPANNSDTVRVKVLGAKTRVLLLEGAPYWDSKFLAQLLRQQGEVDILTVHRLNEERYFRVEATGAEPLQSPDTVFPSNAAELARYDLIVFGKGADGFLNATRIAALQGFVRDQGGSVLFARGKPYSGRFPALEALEPVEWGEPAPGAMKFTPLADAGSGLFGAALPAADDLVWPTLPPLDDINSVARLKPFARVLAEAVPEGKAMRTPLLVVRRFGRGMVAVVNADGLWRWDFRPDVREQGALYQHFWVQLMQWCATYSDFRPGEDYAVRVRDASTEPGQAVRAVVAWRGPTKNEPKPVVKITLNGQSFGETNATALPPGDGGREWAALFTPTQPGRYELRVADATKPAILQGEATLIVPAPPSEVDDLRPDSEALAALAKMSGGEMWSLDAIDKLAAKLKQREAAKADGKPKWQPLWPVWWVAVIVALLFGTEWWMRRREGLL